jgi:sugar lactone lactonase YvrE
MFWNAATNATYTKGNIYTIAGTGAATFSGDGGAATSAGLTAYGICIDASGNLYIADRTNHRIRKFTVGGNISTIAGGASAGSTGDNGVAISALLSGPQGVYVNSSNNIYIADNGNHRIRMIAGSTFTAGGSTYTAGNIYKVAGGTQGYSGDGRLAMECNPHTRAGSGCLLLGWSDSPL